MKKILLSVALIATSFITAQAQCDAPITSTTNGVYIQYVKIAGLKGAPLADADGALIGEDQAYKTDALAHDGLDYISTNTLSDAGYTDLKSDLVVELKSSTWYGLAAYSSSVDGARPATHFKAWIDIDKNGQFDDKPLYEGGELVLASSVKDSDGYIDGKPSKWSSDNEGFYIKDGLIGDYTMRVAMVKAVDDTNPINSCDPLTDGAIVDFTVSVPDPNASPASGVEDILYLVNDGTELKATIDVLSNDDEGTYGISSFAFNDNDTLQAASGAAIEIVDNKVEYTFVDGFGGHDYFTYTVTDNQNNVSEPTSVKIVVYGLHAGEGDKGEILVMEDFEEAPGATIFYDSFSGNYDYNDGNTTVDWLASGGKQDNTLEGALETEKSMSYYIINDDENIADPVSNWSFNDSYSGKKDATNKLKFEVVGSDKPVIGMYVQLWEQKEGAQLGINVKRERIVGGTLETKVFFLKQDVSTFEELTWTFLGFDLSKAVDSEDNDAPVAIEGDRFFVHSIGVDVPADVDAVDANTAWIFDVDLLGVYPDTYIDNGSLSASDSKLEGVKAYPNPVTNVLNIVASQKAVVSVYNVVGEVIYKGVNKEINTQSWSKGLYFVNIKEDGKSATIKVVK